MKYYLDTCIWRDYFENRTDKFRPLGDWALRLINKIIEENCIFLYSETTLTELKELYSEKEIQNMFDIVPQTLVIKVECSEKQFRDAVMFSKQFKIPCKDAIHAVLARDNGAVLVSRDKHFFELQFHVIIKKPEELI